MKHNGVLPTQGKQSISSLELTRELGVIQNTAWKLKHKVLLAICERDKRQRLLGLVLLDDPYGGANRRGGKSGHEATGNTSFMAAVKASPEGNPHRLRLRFAYECRKAVPRWRAARILERVTYVQSDGLYAFVDACESHCTDSPTVTRAGQGSCTGPTLAWVSPALGNGKKSLAGTCHAMDGKKRPLPCRTAS